MFLKIVKLEINKIYSVGYKNNLINCKFVKSTPKGFNFLNINTNNFIFKRHFYPYNKNKDISEDYKIFLINSCLIIK
jgi:hypothetical protein